MENLKEERQQAIMECFKQSQIVHGLIKVLEEFAEDITFEKYEGITIKRGEWQYELLGVKADAYSDESTCRLPEDISLTLTYKVISQINEDQKAEVERFVSDYKRDERRSWFGNVKFGKLFIQLEYEIGIDLVINKNIDLEIDDDDLI